MEKQNSINYLFIKEAIVDSLIDVGCIFLIVGTIFLLTPLMFVFGMVFYIVHVWSSFPFFAITFASCLAICAIMRVCKRLILSSSEKREKDVKLPVAYVCRRSRKLNVIYPAPLG